MDSIIASLQELARENHRVRGPRAGWHIGDIAWGMGMQTGKKDDWHFRTWEDGGRTVAWRWLRLDNGDLDHDVHPDHLHLLDEILDVPEAKHAFAFEDDVTVRVALARHGFESPGPVYHFNVRDLDDLPTVSVPDGFVLRTVEREDLAERVAVHRDVWAPSRVTEESYENVQATPPYRRTLDCVVEAPDGRFAGYALLWPDDDNGVGEFEPVGVREEFRGLGLGHAVCADALRRWREQGGTSAIVYCVNDAACALYRKLGFVRHNGIVRFSR